MNAQTPLTPQCVSPILHASTSLGLIVALVMKDFF